MRTWRSYCIGAFVIGYLMLLLTAAFGSSLAKEIAIGDSLAVGLNLRGEARVGASPKDIVEMIGNIPLERLRGQIVFLSSGILNDPNQGAYVNTELDMLKAAGAHVILIGVSQKAPTALSLWIGALAGSYNVPCVTGFESGDGIHPRSYSDVLKAGRQFECFFYRVCAV